MAGIQGMIKDFDVTITRVNIGFGLSDIIAKNDPRRVVLSIENILGNPFIWPGGPPPSGTNGIPVAAGVPREYRWHDHYALVCTEWWGFSGGGASSFIITEVTYKPER